jgi:thiol:disulfide interchange protein
MRTSLLVLLLCFSALTGRLHAQLSLNLGGGAKEKPVKVSIVSEDSSIAPGKAFRVAIKVEHQKDFHTYGKVLSPEGIGIPMSISWTLPEGWKVQELPWPATHDTPSAGGEVVKGYNEVVYLPAKITPPAGLAVGSKAKLEATVKGAVCDPENCVPIKLPASAEIPVAAEPVKNTDAKAIFEAASANTDTGADGMAKLLLFGFLGGLILNIMPCVFPVLGIKITSIVHQAGEDKKVILMHGLVYTLGVLVCFWTLAAIFQGLKAAGSNVGWGFQLQYAPFVFVVVLILTVFSLNMAGLFEVGTSAVGVGGELQRKSGVGGSFFSGLFATVVATPCAAPLLANALPVALALPLIPSLGFFTVIGLGLASPFLVLSLFPALLKFLPRPGAWMESFKQGMAYLMLGAAAYFVWVLMGLVSEENQRDLLIGLVVIAMACWVYGRWCLPHKPKATQTKALVYAALLAVFGIWWAWPQPKENFWREWSPELVKTLHEDKKPVFVDFTARWCATCQVNHRIYKDESLREEFKKLGVTMLKADWTNPDDRISDALTELKRAAVPVNVLYIPNRAEPLILPNNLTVENVKAALKELQATPAK